MPVDALQSLGTEVLLVNDILKVDPEALANIRKRANMTYARDLAVVTPKGIVLVGKAIDGRKDDPSILIMPVRDPHQ